MFNSYVPLSCTFRVELAVESPMEIPCSYPQEIWHIPGYSIILSGLFHCHYHDLMNYIHLYPFICPDTWDILSSHERSFILPWVFPGSFFFSTVHGMTRWWSPLAAAIFSPPFWQLTLWKKLPWGSWPHLLSFKDMSHDGSSYLTW